MLVEAILFVWYVVLVDVMADYLVLSLSTYQEFVLFARLVRNFKF